MKLRHLSLIIILLLVSCATAPVNMNRNTMEGIASWYGGKFIGRKTANGEIFTSQSLTAANKTLPFGTYVLVTNLNNNKSVIVRINDRGPYVGERIIDLSYAAAKTIDMIGTGTAPVKLQIVKPGEHVGKEEEKIASGMYYLQIGSFSVMDNAAKLKTDLLKKINNVIVDPYTIGGTKYYRVLVGPFKDQIATYIEADKLRDMGYVVIISRR